MWNVVKNILKNLLYVPFSPFKAKLNLTMSVASIIGATSKIWSHKSPKVKLENAIIARWGVLQS